MIINLSGSLSDYPIMAISLCASVAALRKANVFHAHVAFKSVMIWSRDWTWAAVLWGMNSPETLIIKLCSTIAPQWCPALSHPSCAPSTLPTAQLTPHYDKRPITIDQVNAHWKPCTGKEAPLYIPI